MSSFTPPFIPPHGWQSRETNGLAVVSLVFGIMSYYFLVIPFGLFNIPLSLVALHQIEKHGEDGRGLAIAGLALSLFHRIVYFAIFGALLIS